MLPDPRATSAQCICHQCDVRNHVEVGAQSCGEWDPWRAVGMVDRSEFFAEVKAAEPFLVIAGPNVIESAEHCLKMARQIKAVTDAPGLQLIFKASFDKANRTSAASFRGPGLNQGLRFLQLAKERLGVRIVTDVHEAAQCEAVARVADVIQIPAFLCRQTDLLHVAAKTGKVVLTKEGQRNDQPASK